MGCFEQGVRPAIAFTPALDLRLPDLGICLNPLDPGGPLTGHDGILQPPRILLPFRKYGHRTSIKRVELEGFFAERPGVARVCFLLCELRLETS